MKICTRCKKEKELTKYYKASNSSDGRYSMCIECKDSATLAWRKVNKEYYNKTMRDYRAVQDPMRRRDIDLKCWFNLPYGWYEETLKYQGGVCAGCGKSNTSKKRCFAVDHDHKTGKVRGILCYGCNRFMSLLDNDELYKKLLAYKNKP